MPNKKVVVQGAILGFQAPVTGTATFTSAPSLKVKAENKGIYKGSVGFVVNPGTTDGTYTTNSPQTGTFSPQAIKTKVENDKPLREDDKKTLVLNGLNGGGVPGTFSATIIIQDAGQTKVTAG
jgi:hypothetical protein